ncbi:MULTISPECIES: hypothetical protein [unclassified Sphingopyxis]|uniref:phage pre-tape measure protein n=1 Tax=unclassified Sphingopyxis TaxID=2614943 RepID=UPI0028576984|nr:MULTISPECIES: hypothetical protein [unclassified Sphingopyxis]MDR7062014.1 hypothetical protein [Sphingopyxis sp. BE235]MDR7182472.1 hypothetical protein [Sphingopyxis sp. BE249]
MGSLKDVVVKRETVKTAGGDFTVGPLTASDILAIYVAHRGGLQSIFDAYKSGKDPAGIIIDIIATFPDIAAEVIARAADGDECDEATITTARTLDFGAQLDAIEKVGALTVSSVGGLGNLAALVERLAGSLNATMAQQESLSPDGSKTSASSAPSS